MATIRQQVEGETSDVIEPPDSAYNNETQAAPSPAPTGKVNLNDPTPNDQVRTRVMMGKSGPVYKDGVVVMLPYVTARFVQQRLDDAVGRENWTTTFEDVQGGVRCGIGVRINEEWVWKYDAAPYTNIEAIKGGHSDAFKRAAVHWGIARDLYDAHEDAEAEALMQPQAQPPMPQPVVAPQATTTTWGQMPQQQMPQQQAQPQPVPLVNGAPAWVCPLHNDVKIVPAGVSQRTQRPYRAFYACPVPGCDQKGTNV